MVTDETTDHQVLLHTAFNAIVRGDYEAFGNMTTDDVELSIKGFEEINGFWKGREEVVAATRRNFRLLSSQEPEIQGMIAQGNCIALLLEEAGVVRSTGEPYRVRGVQWITFDDGKIQRIEEIIAEA